MRLRVRRPSRFGMLYALPLPFSGSTPSSPPKIVNGILSAFPFIEEISYFVRSRDAIKQAWDGIQMDHRQTTTLRMKRDSHLCRRWLYSITVVGKAHYPMHAQPIWTGLKMTMKLISKRIRTRTRGKLRKMSQPHDSPRLRPRAVVFLRMS